MPIASDFKPDLSKLNWANVTSGVATIIKAVAATTPSPLDDVAADFIATRVVDLIRSGPMPMESMGATEGALMADVQARGLNINRDFLKKILALVQTILPLFI